jgi:hypothetical protein
MKNIVVLGVLLLMGWIGTLGAATRGDGKVLEASDSIRYNVSKLAKDYLLYARYPQKSKLRSVLKERISALDADMHDIAISTKDTKTKGILKYFAYEKMRIEAMIDQKPSDENAMEVLDFSENFSEGARSIAKHHFYVPSPEEELWIVTRSMAQYLEEVIKYYVAQHIIKDDPQLAIKMQAAKMEFLKNLKIINAYSYTEELKATRAYINRLWTTLETYLSKGDRLPLPLLATRMGEQMEASIDLLGVYHSKNQ